MVKWSFGYAMYEITKLKLLGFVTKWKKLLGFITKCKILGFCYQMKLLGFVAECKTNTWFDTKWIIFDFCFQMKKYLDIVAKWTIILGLLPNVSFDNNCIYLNDKKS